MNEIEYNLQFEGLCENMQLGNIIDGPTAISGGLLHRMYAVETTKGKFAIKAINPQIIKRPTAMDNYITSEKIADLASKHIPAVSAIKFSGFSMQKLDNQYYLVFNWVEGRTLKADEINSYHCEKMGRVLADIHLLDFSKLDINCNPSKNKTLYDWNYYLNKGEEENIAWGKSMSEIIHKLYYWNREANRSEALLSSNMVISHRDLDCKNVLWNKDNPIIIDWESAGYINPMQDLTETAVYWSEDEKGNIDKEKFLSFIKGYKNRCGIVKTDWRMVLLNGFSSKLGWLNYNLKRSLGIECTDEAERYMGISQVTETISSLNRYSEEISELESWLNNDI